MLVCKGLNVATRSGFSFELYESLRMSNFSSQFLDHMKSYITILCRNCVQVP